MPPAFQLLGAQHASSISKNHLSPCCAPAHARAAQIELCGFKSYKDKLLTAPFSPKINVVVGANGSGKSNFFHGEPGHGMACRELAQAAHVSSR